MNHPLPFRLTLEFLVTFTFSRWIHDGCMEVCPVHDDVGDDDGSGDDDMLVMIMMMAMTTIMMMKMKRN